MNRGVELSGVKKIRLHDLRHSHVNLQRVGEVERLNWNRFAMCWNIIMERKMRWKKKHTRDMILKEKAGDVMDTENQKALKRKETLKAISEMCLLDDNLITLVFARNIEATELLLNIILQRSDLKVLEVVGQRAYEKPMSGGFSVTIDIYAVDGNDKVYDVEVQRASEGSDPHRAGSHSSMVDTKMLKAGQEFNEIHDSYVIFITAGDAMGAGRSLYHIHMFYPVLARPVKYFKETEGGQEIMCEIFENLAEKWAEERALEEKKHLLAA